MTHEPECWANAKDATTTWCCCATIHAAYQRGYTTGWNDHARTVQHWQDTHGAYRQHGEGENP